MQLGCAAWPVTSRRPFSRPAVTRPLHQSSAGQHGPAFPRLSCPLEPHAIGSWAQPHSQSAMKHVHPTEKHVGRRLRMRRLMLNKSQSDIARTNLSTGSKVRKGIEPRHCRPASGLMRNPASSDVVFLRRPAAGTEVARPCERRAITLLRGRISCDVGGCRVGLGVRPDPQTEGAAGDRCTCRADRLRARGARWWWVRGARGCSRRVKLRRYVADCPDRAHSGRKGDNTWSLVIATGNC
jgi:hypothetical protein